MKLASLPTGRQFRLQGGHSLEEHSTDRFPLSSMTYPATQALGESLEGSSWQETRRWGYLCSTVSLRR